MNYRDSGPRASLNVVGCQWSAPELQDLPKTAYFMHAESTVSCDGLRSTVAPEGMDLKLENERRLQEMREQGRQCVLERGHSSREEGAANLLARFHSMQWMRQPHADVAAAPQSGRPVDHSNPNLVPVKHHEDEYFAGTRQQKKSRRSKNARPKCEVVKLEEVMPHPSEKILPAGCPPSYNAWAGRKGSELFDSRKLSLTLYGPADPEEVYQRAVQESLITWQEEQNRIVNMFSSVPDEKVSLSTKPASAPRNLPNEVVDAWTIDEGLSVGNKGGGDGRWIQNSWNNNRADVRQDQHVKDKPNGSKSNYGNDLPENSCYLGRNRPSSIHQDCHRPSNDKDESYQTKVAYGNWDSVDRKCSENSSSVLRDQPKFKSRMDAGDGLYNAQLDRRPGHNRAQDMSNKEGYKERELESLGFGKTRNEQFSQRETLKKRDVQQNRERSGFRMTGQHEQQGRPHQKGQSISKIGPEDVGKNYKKPEIKEKRISFSEPLVQQCPKNERSSIGSSDIDECWEEDEDKVESQTETAGGFLTTIQPRYDRKPQRSSPTNQEEKKELLSQRCSPINQGEHIGKQSPKILVDEKHRSQRETRQTVVQAHAPGPVESSPTTEVSAPDDEEMKKMREEIEFLDSRLKILSTALEQSHGINAALQTQGESKADSNVPLEEQQSVERASPSRLEEVTDVPQTHFWLQNVPSTFSHPLIHPSMLPAVHPLLHPSMHPAAQLLTHSQAQAHLLAQSQSQSANAQQPPQGEGLSEQQPHSQTPLSTEALLNAMQGQIPAAGTNPDVSAQIAQYLAHQQQQQQHLILQGAAAAAACSPGCPPRPALGLNWLGLRAALPHATGNWLSQMGLSAGLGAAHSASAMPNTATLSSAANTSVHGALPNHVNSSSVAAANEKPAAADQSPNIHSASGFPVSPNSVLENPASANIAATADQIVAVDPGSTLHMQWIAQMNAFQQQQQQRMARLMSAMPTVHALPMQPIIPSMPASLGATGFAWQSVQTAAKIPPQYEGDWIISPADEARLGQGLPLIPPENRNSVDASQEGQRAPAASNFADPALSPVGSARALGLPIPTALKPARTPAHLANLKIHQPDAQVIVNSAAAIDVFHTSHLPSAQQATPKGLKSNASSRPDEPRGRGRLR